MKKQTFFFGLVCGLLLFPVAFISYDFLIGSSTQNSSDDFQEIIMYLTPIKRETESLLEKGEAFSSGVIKPDSYGDDKALQAIYRSTDGDLIAIKGNQQLVWLHPRVDSGVVIWSCIAVPKTSSPLNCADYIHSLNAAADI